MADFESEIIPAPSIGRVDVGVPRSENFRVNVTTIQLSKDNYLRWSAAMTMGIAGR